MGIGMVVWGLASVIIGEALVGTNAVGHNDHRCGHGLCALPVAGRHGVALGTQSQRPEADHGRVRLLRAHRAANSCARNACGAQACLRSFMLEAQRDLENIQSGHPE